MIFLPALIAEPRHFRLEGAQAQLPLPEVGGVHPDEIKSVCRVFSLPLEQQVARPDGCSGVNHQLKVFASVNGAYLALISVYNSLL